MPLNCNIDSRGKLARLIYGMLLILIGVLLIVFFVRGSGMLWKWALSVACVAGGAFAVFEARAGWCVVRAMGFKTPM